MTDLPFSDKMQQLAEKWLNNSITDQEKKEFLDWYNQFNDEELLLAPEYRPVIRRLKEEMLINIQKKIAADDLSPPYENSAVLYRMKWLRVSVAAVLVLVIAAGALILVSPKKAAQPRIAGQKTLSPAPADVLPGSNKALLTLGDGSTIVLDSANTGNLARQGNTQVLKLGDGQLKYKSGPGDDRAAVSYNTLATPRGGQYRLVLPDGSQVWLNAASRIRYPTAFIGHERRVTVSGEAYFEIAANASMPFKVLVDRGTGNKDPMEIEVLGTQFNVNAYADETAIRTTLLEGSVKLIKGTSSGVMKPGQQAQLEENGEIRWIPGADVEKAVAWKNGVFEFGDENLQTVMRQIARWYDVEVEYEGNIPADRFTGRVSRKTSLSGVLKILQLSDIRFTVENKKIIVRS
jgi:ferric-dicitrate binding protein FerR (iron transport regulator)